MQSDANGARGGLGVRWSDSDRSGCYAALRNRRLLLVRKFRSPVASWCGGLGSHELPTPAAIDTLFFYVAVAYAANTPNNLPGLGSPALPVASLRSTRRARPRTQASSSLPIPRFIDNADHRAMRSSINQCVTNLLFPFVTNQAGFDTGHRDQQHVA